jgi:hypothetical protein
VVQLLLWAQPINSERFDLLKVQSFDEMLFATIGANEVLQSDVIDTLIKRNDETLVCHLAANNTLNVEQLKKIYAKGLESSFEYLAANPGAPVEMLEVFYKAYDMPAIRIALAHNTATPEPILRALFDRNELEIYRSMASNASVPLDILDMLKVDTRLQNELAKNEILVKEYEVVLDYDKKAVQF